MSEKQQRTSVSMRERMLNRYGDGTHHKHDKNHHPYRQHCRSHPVTKALNGSDETSVNTSTGLLREFKARKIRKRLDKGRFH
ncbi:hypothetical protein [Legionella erythra]|uniref:Uncharacterized protein n=1 Tax=Legionella erythra TaxID=448 RepID=A0A0W0TGB4_LEGER|nr:hypothetical protein [Legionella erythra]KTC94626.1 hypothetical protein Lery_2793 [Legionella erythra]